MTEESDRILSSLVHQRSMNTPLSSQPPTPLDNNDNNGGSFLTVRLRVAVCRCSNPTVPVSFKRVVGNAAVLDGVATLILLLSSFLSFPPPPFPLALSFLPV